MRASRLVDLVHAIILRNALSLVNSQTCVAHVGRLGFLKQNLMGSADCEPTSALLPVVPPAFPVEATARLLQLGPILLPRGIATASMSSGPTRAAQRHGGLSLAVGRPRQDREGSAGGSALPFPGERVFVNGAPCCALRPARRGDATAPSL
jgi:hypothetical protein